MPVSEPNPILEIARDVRRAVCLLAGCGWHAGAGVRGWCAVGAVMTVRELRAAGFQAELHRGVYEMEHGIWVRRWGHAWAVCEGVIIVDVTASQFGCPPVYILPVAGAEQYHTRARGRRALQDINTTWPEDQRPAVHGQALSWRRGTRADLIA